MADIDSMVGYATTWYGKASRWYFIVCLLVIAPLLLLFIFVMAMIGGFDMSYKAWDQANARYQVPNPEYDDWIQGIIIALQVNHRLALRTKFHCQRKIWHMKIKSQFYLKFGIQRLYYSL